MIDASKLAFYDLIDYAPDECLGEQFPLYWQMTRAERFCLLHLLRTFEPELALEIGTYRGGSLQAISRYSQSVISVDIDPGVQQNLKGHFNNVDFRTGDSVELLPNIIRELNASDKQVGFVLIDGDHSENGVRRDANTVLGLTPKRPICIVMHDSFYAPCRQGMRTAAWADCPYVHYVELDFISGAFIPGRDTADISMVGGFGVTLMLPEKRATELNVFESQRPAYETMHRFAAQSGYVNALPVTAKQRLLRPIKAGLDSVGLLGPVIAGVRRLRSAVYQ